MKHLYFLFLPGYILSFSFAANFDILCPHPDVPTNGRYTPHQRKFEPGDEITYSCKKGFALAGKERRICKLNGAWSDHTPFCDPSVTLSDPSVTNRIAPFSSLLRVIDGHSKTCFDWHNATGEHLYLHLNKTVVIRLVKIFFKKGITKVQILTGQNNDMKVCADFDNFVETDRWVEIKCESNALADTLKVLVLQTHNRLMSLCELEVYGKEKDSCEHSSTRSVTHGHFEVSRTKATLICEDGYSSKNNRLVCEGNNSWIGGGFRCEEILCNPRPNPNLIGGEWKFSDNTKKLSFGTASKLSCNSGYYMTGVNDTIICQRNGTWSKTNATCVENDKSKPSTRRIILGSVIGFVVFLIIALLAAMIHIIRKHKNKEVVVVYQSQSDGSVPLSSSEIEYASPRYEDLKPRPPELPSSPRPLAKLSTMSRPGIVESGGSKNLTKLPFVPPDLTFGTMKSSEVYSS